MHSKIFSRKEGWHGSIKDLELTRALHIETKSFKQNRGLPVIQQKLSQQGNASKFKSLVALSALLNHMRSRWQ